MKQNIILGLLIAIAVVLIFGLFNRKPDSQYLELVKAKDETIKAITAERDVFRQWKDDEVREGLKKDSLLQLRYKTNTIKYEKIPVIINSLDREGLRAAGERAVE